MSANMQQQPQGPAPFILNAPRRFRPVPDAEVDWVSGKEFTFKFPVIGYLIGFYVHISGVMTLSSGGALKDEGPWNLIKKFLIETNEGGGELDSFSGYGGFMEALVRVNKGFRPDLAGVGSSTPHPDVYRVGVASGGNNWDMWFFVPVTVNRYMNRNVGLINLQAEGIKGTLKVTTDVPLTAVTNATGFVGKISVYYEHLGVPDHFDANGNMIVEVPELIRARTVETTDNIDRAGQEVKVKIPQAGTLYHVIHEVVLNNARSDSIDTIGLKFLDEVQPILMDREWARYMQRLHYGIEFPVGVYALDFFSSTQFVGDGITPDVIDTTELVLTESRIKIPDDATLGAAGTNFIRTIIMYTQRMKLAGQ